MAAPEQPQRDELIVAVKSMAPFPILMATFMLVYAMWFGVAWSVVGWAVFALFGVYAVWLIFLWRAAYPRNEKIAQASTNASQQTDR